MLGARHHSCKRPLKREAVEGDFEQAVADFAAAVRLNPRDADSHIRLAWLLGTCPKAEVRDGRRAVRHARETCELKGWEDSASLETLAAACAEAGDFAEAVKWQKKALASPEFPKSQREQAGQRLKLYEAGKPFRYK